jgi:hypothetical protein
MLGLREVFASLKSRSGNPKKILTRRLSCRLNGPITRMYHESAIPWKFLRLCDVSGRLYEVTIIGRRGCLSTQNSFTNKLERQTRRQILPFQQGRHFGILLWNTRILPWLRLVTCQRGITNTSHPGVESTQLNLDWSR